MSTRRCEARACARECVGERYSVCVCLREVLHVDVPHRAPVRHLTIHVGILYVPYTLDCPIHVGLSYTRWTVLCTLYTLDCLIHVGRSQPGWTVLYTLDCLILGDFPVLHVDVPHRAPVRHFTTPASRLKRNDLAQTTGNEATEGK